MTKLLHKYYAVLVVVVAVALFVTVPAFAQTAGSPSGSQHSMPPVRSNQQSQMMDKLKVKGEAEIDRRVTALTNLVNRVNEMKKLSVASKQSLTGQVQTEITNLTTLRAKIVADTDLPTLRTDIQSIVKSYRVYLLFMPQLHILATADRINVISDEMNGFVTKLQDHIQQAQAKGQNVTASQAAVADIQTKIADAKSQANAAQTEVATLKPDGYPGNKPTLEDAHSKIKLATSDLKAARQDIQLILQGLKGLNTNPMATPSAKPPHIIF